MENGAGQSLHPDVAATAPSQNQDRPGIYPQSRDMAALLGWAQPPKTDGLTISEVCAAIWSSKFLVLSTTLTAILLVVAWLNVATPLYTASMTVTAASKGAGKTSGFNMPDIGAVLGGDFTGATGDKDFNKFLSILESVTLAHRLEQNHGILKSVFAPQWDSENNRWAEPQGALTGIKHAVKGVLNMPPWSPPTAVDLAGFIGKKVDVVRKQQSPLRVITFSHEDRDFAIAFLNALHREADAMLREEAILRTTEQVAYLKEKLRSLTINEQRQTFIDMLSDQENTMMLLQVNLPYAAAVIDPAEASVQPTFPRGGLSVVIATIGGFVLGSVIALLRHMARRKRSEAAALAN